MSPDLVIFSAILKWFLVAVFVFSFAIIIGRGLHDIADAIRESSRHRLSDDDYDYDDYLE